MFDPSLIQPLPPAVTSERIDAAVAASRAAARGRSRAEVRELLVAELRARGLMPPPPAVDLLIGQIVDGPAQRAAQRLAVQAKLGSFAFRFLSAAMRHRPGPRWDVTATRLVHSSLRRRPVEVILDQDASRHLAVGDADTFDVWFGLTTLSPGRDPGAATQPVTVFRGDYQVGVLDADASAAWRRLVHDGRGTGQTIITLATRKLADNGEWRLLTGLPHGRGG